MLTPESLTVGASAAISGNATHELVAPLRDVLQDEKKRFQDLADLCKTGSETEGEGGEGGEGEAG